MTSPTATELERQLENLLRLDYPALMGSTESDLRTAVGHLAGLLPNEQSEVDPEDHIPFVLVPNAPLRESALLMTKDDRPATLMIEDAELGEYAPIAGVTIPDAPLYLLTDIDTGTEFTNVTPESALGTVTGRGRTPLTIAEGIAVVTQRPDMLRKNKCFSLLGSRRGGQKVPAIWISQRAPKLGWCWDRNPHTWLGSASAGARVVRR
ncbi:DUF5701 family protein [Pseudactinotalea sp.]|uniref:DUF5701 family protein n=1 Tax=Pseudactinotalea sp. TaxID=1926260 RepID=UPI003B3ADC8A